MIREATWQDAPAILHIRKKLTSEREFFLTEPDEFKDSVENQEENIVNIERNGGRILVADVEGEVVAYFIFQRTQLIRMRHTGSLVMGILKGYRNQHLGTKLLTHFIDWATQQKDLEKVCLGVISSNVRAIRLYESLGFVEEGRERKQIKYQDGCYRDNVLMARYVN